MIDIVPYIWDPTEFSAIAIPETDVYIIAKAVSTDYQFYDESTRQWVIDIAHSILLIKLFQKYSAKYNIKIVTIPSVDRHVYS